MHKAMALVLMRRASREVEKRDYFLSIAARAMVMHHFMVTHADLQMS